MPTMTIYIRTEDLDKWLQLGNRSEFVHNALNDNKPVVKSKVVKPRKEVKVIEPTYKKTQHWSA